MKILRMLFLILAGSSIMYVIAYVLTKEQREYLSVPTRDELMARECRQALWDFAYYNEDAFESWERMYGKGFVVYAALRTLETAQIHYGHPLRLKGWTEYNASR